jgi:hypothetical protein
LNLSSAHVNHQHYIPLIDLGEVFVNDVDNCEHQLRPLRLICEAQYRKSVNATIHRHNMDTSTESVRRAVCCGVWRARDCVANAAINIKDCGHNVAKRYQSMPSLPYIKEEVADMCSEYDENAPICSNASLLHISFWNIITLYILKFIKIL